MAVLNEEIKQRIYKDLAERMIACLEKGEILNDDAQQSATMMLGIDNVSSLDECLILLEELKTRWPIYNTVYLSWKDELMKEQDTAKVEEIQNKLKQFISSPPTTP